MWVSIWVSESGMRQGTYIIQSNLLMWSPLLRDHLP